jgi:hypothetical protein
VAANRHAKTEPEEHTNYCCEFALRIRWLEIADEVIVNLRAEMRAVNSQKVMPGHFSVRKRGETSR